MDTLYHCYYCRYGIQGERGHLVGGLHHGRDDTRRGPLPRHRSYRQVIHTGNPRSVVQIIAMLRVALQKQKRLLGHTVVAELGILQGFTKWYRKYVLQITQPFQYRCTQLQYRFAVISDSPSTYDINYDTVDHDTMSPKQNGSRNIRTDEKTRSYNAKLQSSAAHKTF